MNSKTKSNHTETCETIKLGIDAHAKWFYVARQLDGATPQPVQKMTLEGLLRFVARQLGLHLGIGLRYDEALLRRVQRHIHFRLPTASMRRELFALIPFTQPGTGEGQIAHCLRLSPLRSDSRVTEEPGPQRRGHPQRVPERLNAIHAGSRDPDPAKWVVTEEMLMREIKGARAAMARHSGKDGSARRIGFGA